MLHQFHYKLYFLLLGTFCVLYRSEAKWLVNYLTVFFLFLMLFSTWLIHLCFGFSHISLQSNSVALSCSSLSIFLYGHTMVAISLVTLLTNFGLQLQSEYFISTSVPSFLSFVTFPKFNIHFPGFAFFMFVIVHVLVLDVRVVLTSGFVLNCFVLFCFIMLLF